MRIELCASGAMGGSIGGCCVDLNQHIFDTEAVLSGFTAIKTHVTELNGGIGKLQTAADALDTRISEETERQDRLQSVSKSFHNFLDTAAAADRTAAEQIDQEARAFYKEYPHLQPMSLDQDKSWFEKAMDFLLGEELVDDIKQVYEVCSGALMDFYEKHKKLCDTIAIVVGAAVAIVGVVASGGTALVPLLVHLGVSYATATTISAAIAVTAVVSKTVASMVNIADVWGEYDNPLFNGLQSVLNFVDNGSNLVYSVGELYNSVTGVSGKEFAARHDAIENGKVGYDNLNAEHPAMKHKPGGDFTDSRKKAIYEENMRRNNGVLRSDQTGKILEPPKKSLPGVKPSPYEAQIDHINPKSLGGTNNFNNAQVIERRANIIKGDSLNFNEYLEYSKPDKADVFGMFKDGSEVIKGGWDMVKPLWGGK